MKSSSYSKATYLLSGPPTSAEAKVEVLPIQYTYFLPRLSHQVSGNEVEFSFGMFGDKANIDYYQYMLQTQTQVSEWISVGKMVRSNGNSIL